MRRFLSFVLPQALLVPLGFLAGLLWGTVDALGGWSAAVMHVSQGASGPGPGHAGTGFFVVLAAALAILLLALAASLTVNGIAAGLTGAAFAFVLSCLLDWLLLHRREIAGRDIEIIKRWAGRGALLSVIGCAWVALFNPIREVAGILAITGTFVCLGFGTLGLLQFLWKRFVRNA